jgi:phasin family protein
MAGAKSRSAKSPVETYEQVATASTDAVRENFDRGLAALSEASAFSKQNVEAWLASAAAAQKGFETLSARSVAFQREALEKHMAAAKSLMTAKSVQEFVEKQSDYAKSSFEAYVAELSKVSDLVAGLAKDTLQPINERVNAVGHLMQAGAAR